MISDPYRVNPTATATRLVRSTAGRLSMRTSTSGLADRSSAAHQAANSAADASRAPPNAADSQPQDGASVSAVSSVTSQADSRTAQVRLTRPPARTGDSGMRSMISVARTTSGSGAQNSQW